MTLKRPVDVVVDRNGIPYTYRGLLTDESIAALRSDFAMADRYGISATVLPPLAVADHFKIAAAAFLTALDRTIDAAEDQLQQHRALRATVAELLKGPSKGGPPHGIITAAELNARTSDWHWKDSPFGPYRVS